MFGVPGQIGSSKVTRVPVFEIWETSLKKKKVKGVGLKAVKGYKKRQRISPASSEALDPKTHSHLQGIAC